MFSSIVNIVGDIALTPDRRKVKQYLDAATRDTVSADLGKVLSPRLRSFKERQLVRDAFDKQCIEDPSSHQKYWTADSFRNHVRDALPAAVVSDAAIALLWKCFHFYAHHPCPRNPDQHARLDFEAFKRAALLTVFQCDAWLGTLELDYYWRKDGGSFARKAGFARILRSIAVPTPAVTESQVIATTPDLSDVMDVLVTVCPQLINAIPSEAQLVPIAGKLFAEEPAVARRDVVRREDLSTLLDLLLRLELDQEKWAGSYHFGTLVEVNPSNRYLTEVLVNSLSGEGNEQTFNVQQLSEQVDLMDNFLVRFQQLWAVLFQPPRPTETSKPTIDEAGVVSISGVISLFAPYIQLDNSCRQRPEKQDTRLTLETIQDSADSRDTTMTRLRRGLSDNSSANVVLFEPAVVLGDESKTIIGAYLPVAWEKTHFLFQLQPKFRLLRWEKPKLSALDLIKPEVRVTPSKNAENESSKSPYTIGDPQGLGVGLHIVPEKGTATLRNIIGGCYVEGPPAGKGAGAESWHVTIQDARMDVLAASGGEDGNDAP